MANSPAPGAEEPIRDRPNHVIRKLDDGKRTMHGIAPLDPSYQGTVIEDNAGVREAKAARVAVGLEKAEGPAPGGE